MQPTREADACHRGYRVMAQLSVKLGASPLAEVAFKVPRGDAKVKISHRREARAGSSQPGWNHTHFRQN